MYERIAYRECASLLPDQVVGVHPAVPAPKKITHVEPVFPKGRRGSIEIELTIGREGRVEKFNVLCGEFGLFEAAEAAIRQWVFEPVIVDGKAVPVLQTFSFSAK